MQRVDTIRWNEYHGRRVRHRRIITAAVSFTVVAAIAVFGVSIGIAGNTSADVISNPADSPAGGVSTTPNATTTRVPPNERPAIQGSAFGVVTSSLSSEVGDGVYGDGMKPNTLNTVVDQEIGPEVLSRALYDASAVHIPVTDDMKPTPNFTVVESLPIIDFDLPPIPGTRNTTAALLGLVDSAKHTLDVTAMYWSLIANPDPSGGHHFTPSELARLGAASGQALYDALDRAAGRGVKMRFVNGAGIGLPLEAQQLQAKHPGAIQMKTWNATAWYCGGIMHQKLWIADRGRAPYIGSANMDWLSLSQVKEMSVLVENAGGTKAAQGVECGTMFALFERWWSWCDLKPSTVVAFDHELHVNRTLPCWSWTVPESQRCADPFASPSCTPPPASSDQGYTLSASPREMLGPVPTSSSGIPHIPWDLDMITDTIYAAQSTIDISVMDVVPSNIYGGSAFGYVWWTELFDAITTAAVTNGVRVRLLVSSWAHTTLRQPAYLKALLAQGVGVCSIRDSGEEWADEPQCSGSLEVKEFMVPGWNNTDGQDAKFLPYSRVNHAKYVVTDLVANIGTSNWAWGYFYNTAGASLNTGNMAVRSAVQSIFNRDWNSQYATPLP